ncbi:hypothetical protein GOP47_0021346 [Adiantum capillus-veneris]|uniref:Uncharacterized protein n=1 Tax=Adiantum capillus-veneris TaxID=13818 RepID=A0A9D4Z664_ADICA|nr:hypothetical protein GOP47_0021346 [Adiantum capillus-veneris]
MMGKGAEGGCTRNGCNGGSSAGILPLSKGLVNSGSVSRMRGNMGQEWRSLDVFSQALKSLAVKPAFGELGTAASNSSLNTPISSENKRKQRTKKNDVNGTSLRDSFENAWYKDLNGGPFWLHMGEYFREPTPQDIQLLVPRTKLDMWSLCSSPDSLLQMPVSGIADNEVIKRELSKETQRPSALNLMQLYSLCLDDESLQAVSLGQIASLKMLEQQDKTTKRKLVASGSSNKRRRLMSSTDAVTAVISPPENGDEDLCHVCYGGECDEKNQILFCNSCNVAVHQECYGIKAVPEDQWLCCMCRHRSDMFGNTQCRDSHDCVLCPVKGGALKLIAPYKEQACDAPTAAAFAHLFCCQWIPETYIGDVEFMEPIMNVEGVREERWKLLCSICKEKHGACIQCSHGMCATAFHPLCARQSNLRMEVSSKANGNEIDLRAFCSKHTSLNGKPVLSTRSDGEIDYDTVDANGGTVNKSCSNKAGKKLKVAISRREDDCVLAGAVADSDGPTQKRGIIMNGGLSINAMKGLMGRRSSTVMDVDAIQMKKNGNILSDKEVQERVHDQNPGLSCFPNLQKLTPPLMGKNAMKSSDDERKESNLSNRKESSCRSYRNKRRRLEQQALMSQMRLEQDAEVPDNDSLRSSPVEHTETQCDSPGRLGNEYLQPTISMPWDQYVEEGSNNDEDRRLRGINGEASTSQDHVFTSQRTAQLHKLLNAHKDQGDIGPISVLEGKACRLEDRAKIHPFLLTRLLNVQSSIAVRDSEIETGKTTDLSSFPDGLGSVSLHVEGPQVKVSRSKRCQSQSSTHKRSPTSKSAKNVSGESFEAQLKQLECAKKIGVLDMAPENDLEEAILAAQLNLVVQAQRNRHQCEQLVLKIIPNLSKELRASWKKSRDLALVSQYLSMLREAKKQGRKERRSKEAQANLAAAAAVAAASSRLGAVRKDAPAINDEKHSLAARDSFRIPTTETSQSLGGYNTVRSTLRKPTSYGWTTSSQTSSCGKASSLDQDIKAFDSTNHAVEFNSGESREELVLCDICKDSSVPSPTTICQRCKVVVHQQCYGLNSVLTSDWLCQPCLEIIHQSQGLNAPDAIERASPGHGILCFLCFGLSGAFKRSVEGKWAHVFCVQWFPEFSDKDEAGLHDSTKIAAQEKIVQECSVCHMKQGARLRCSFGHCHGTFHPLCARDSGLYMSVKRSSGGRIQHRAYCEKHSAQQRQKAASRIYGSSDELNVLLQMRAELERVRILCERVCKRERLKRDRLFCTLDLYTAHLSSLSSSAMASNDLSSTSNTFGTTVAIRKMSALHTPHSDSLAERPHHHGLESESLSWNSVAGEGIKYQDSLSGDSVYQTQISCSEPSRETPARSQLTDAFHAQGRLNMFVGAVAKNCEQKRLGKHQKAETLHTEVVMTPTEASVQNQRLPKGYAYVPVGTLPKGKPILSEASVLKDT